MLALLTFLSTWILLASPVAPAGQLPGPMSPPRQAPFGWTLPVDGPETSPHDPPLLPDLSVQWIERAPRFPRYCLDYSRGLPELCPGTEDDQHFPTPGEAITFTAHIANQGLASSLPVAASWEIQAAQGAPSQTLTATLPGLPPGITTTLTLTWSWSSQPHTVTLTLDPASTLYETARSNNQLANRSDALYLEILVHPQVHDAFAARPNLAGSWSFADWIQAQFAAMNDNLAAAVYAETPLGVSDRVRIDRIRVTEGVGGDIVTSTLDFDGRWTFRVEQNDPDTPEDEGAISAENYAAVYANRVDWGLVHELTHQLGMIDLYQLNVAESFQNEVLDADGRPLLMGFQWPNPGLMGGGDRAAYPWTSYSRHTAIALSRNSGLRRGYFGEYLFDLPSQNSLQVLDNRGQPLAGVAVTLYQTAGGTVRATPVATGTTDLAGRYHLPARPLAMGPVTTATGHELAPNPFGTIDVVGFNGQLLAEISRQEQRTFAWWPITDFNLAAWQGIGSYERVIATHLPPAAQPGPEPPPELRGRTDGIRVTLAWTPSPSAGVVAYRLYRGLEPAFYPLQALTTTSSLHYELVSDRTARYAVTALDQDGRESGLSPLFRSLRTFNPVGIAVDPSSGLRTILDRHLGALVTQLADGRWIGRQGSVHLGLVGSQALAQGPQGELLVAVTGEDRLKILNPERELVNWFGRERFVTGTLAGPSGVVLTGEPFTVERQAVADPNTLGLASFDEGTALSGVLPLQMQGVSLAPGRFGNAVQIDGEDRLLYDASGHLEPDQGSLELWIKPQWPWNDSQEHVFVEVGQALTTTRSTNPSEHSRIQAPCAPQAEGPLSCSPATLVTFQPATFQPATFQPATSQPATSQPAAALSYRLRLAKGDWNGLYAWLRDGPPGIGHDLVLYAGIEEWQPDSWHHLAVTWQAVQPDTPYRRYVLWVDGKLQDSQVTRRPVEAGFQQLSVGAGLDGIHQADALLDELHFSRVARVGNSQQGRLIISQANGHRLGVMDWLGNPISSLGGHGVEPGQFTEPRELLLVNDQIVVADSGNGRLQVLDFDGNELSWQATWQASLVRPWGLAWAGGDGSENGSPYPWLLVSDRGDNQVKLLDGQGNLLRRWTGPDGGFQGSFWQPAGLVILPEGGALVADAGNGRVVPILGPLSPVRRYLPIMNHSVP